MSVLEFEGLGLRMVKIWGARQVELAEGSIHEAGGFLRHEAVFSFLVEHLCLILFLLGRQVLWLLLE